MTLPLPRKKLQSQSRQGKANTNVTKRKKLQRVLVHSSTDLYYERLMTDWGSFNTGLAMLSFLCASRKVSEKWNITKETCSYNKCYQNWTNVYLIFWQRQYIINSLTSTSLWRQEMVLKFYGKQYKKDGKIQQFSSDLEHQVIRFSISWLLLVKLVLKISVRLSAN